MGYGSEALYIGAAMAAAGAATTSYANSQQLKKQDQIAAAGIIKQGEFQRKGEADVSSTIGQVAKSNALTQSKANDQLAQYRAALQQGSGTSNSASPNVPGAGKAYKSAQATAGASANDYVGKLATSAATTQGTQLERVNEGEQMGDTATKLGLLNNQAQNQNYLTKLQIQQTQANPWLKGLGTLLSVAGTAVGGAGALSGAASGAETAAEAAGAAGSIGSGAAGTIGLTNAFTGVGSMAASGAATAASEAGLGGSLFGNVGSYLSALSSTYGKSKSDQAGP